MSYTDIMDGSRPYARIIFAAGPLGGAAGPFLAMLLSGVDPFAASAVFLLAASGLGAMLGMFYGGAMLGRASRYGVDFRDAAFWSASAFSLAAIVTGGFLIVFAVP